METTKLEKGLKSIGKKSFIEDYEVYSNFNLSKKEKVELLSEKYSKNGATIRVSFAEEVFKHAIQNDALKIIVKSSRLDRKVIEKAKALLSKNHG